MYNNCVQIVGENVTRISHIFKNKFIEIFYTNFYGLQSKESQEIHRNELNTFIHRIIFLPSKIYVIL